MVDNNEHVNMVKFCMQWNWFWETIAMRDHLSWKTRYSLQKALHFNAIEPAKTTYFERPVSFVWPIGVVFQDRFYCICFSCTILALKSGMVKKDIKSAVSFYTEAIPITQLYNILNDTAMILLWYSCNHGIVRPTPGLSQADPSVSEDVRRRQTESRTRIQQEHDSKVTR